MFEKEYWTSSRPDGYDETVEDFMRWVRHNKTDAAAREMIPILLKEYEDRKPPMTWVGKALNDIAIFFA